MKRYAVVIERGPNNYSAFVPDLPGCIATGRTVDQARRRIRLAIELHLAGLAQDGLPAPKPTTRAVEVEVHTAA